MIQSSHQPEPSLYLSPHIFELSLSIRQIVFESSPEILPIRHEESSLTMFHIIFKVAFILDPLISQLLHVGEVEFLLKRLNFIIVQDSISTKFVLRPLSFVGQLPTGVVKDSSALHPVFHPLSTVLSSIIVVESSKTMAISTYFVTLILALLEKLCHILRFSLPLVFLPRTHEALVSFDVEHFQATVVGLAYSRLLLRKVAEVRVFHQWLSSIDLTATYFVVHPGM